MIQEKNSAYQTDDKLNKKSIHECRSIEDEEYIYCVEISLIRLAYTASFNGLREIRMVRRMQAKNKNK